MSETVNYTINTMGYSSQELENLYPDAFAFNEVKYSPTVDDTLSSGENKTEQK